MIPVAKNKRTSYENFVAECPWCGRDSIFNRASDLHTFEPIAGRDVACQRAECGKPFRIMGDRVNNAHETLLFDCDELVERKHYMACILNLAQAYEVFFSLFFRVELLYRPFAADPDQGLDELNRLAEVLSDRLKRHAFSSMRGLFLQHIVAARAPSNLVESAKMVSALPEQPRNVKVPKDSALDSLNDAKLAPLLKSLKATDIHVCRNNVVHKRAYRPTGVEVQKYLEEAESILFPLTDHLDLDDDINRYVMARP
jgi:hypothetical protein